MAVISTPPSFQLLMAHATVSIDPFMHFQKQKGLKLGVRRAASVGGCHFLATRPLAEKADAGIVRMLPEMDFFLASFAYVSNVKQLEMFRNRSCALKPDWAVRAKLFTQW